MTIKELIQELSKYDLDYNVVVSDVDCWGCPVQIDYVTKSASDNTVIIALNMCGT